MTQGGDPASAWDAGFDTAIAWRRPDKAAVRALDEVEREAYAEGYAEGRAHRPLESVARGRRAREVKELSDG